jgi:hypothetical protein
VDGLVEFEVGVAQDAVLGRRGDLGAAQDGLDPEDDFFEVEGFGDVVVAADGEAGDAVADGVAGGEEEDGQVAGGPEALGDFEAVHVGEHDVEDDEVGLEAGGGAEGLGGVAGDLDLETGEAEGGGQERADVLLVVDDEDAVFGLGRFAHLDSLTWLPGIPTGAARSRPGSRLRER